MSRSYRYISIALAILLSMSVFSACGADGGSAPASTAAAQVTDAPADAAEETEPETTEIPDGLPETDFGGRTFNLAVRSSRIYDFFTEEQNGEAQIHNTGKLPPDKSHRTGARPHRR